MTGLLFALLLPPLDLPFVHPLFSDNMVLQRDRKDPVWGWAKPGEKITVEIGGKQSMVRVGADGKWMTTVGPFKAGGPYELTVKGDHTQTFRNVMLGEVWICSGQSNMEMGMANLKDPDHEIAAANYPNIRFYRVPKVIAGRPLPTTAGDWKVCTPDSARDDGDWGGFSATAFFFGRQLYQDLNVPIGLIHTSWGGTIAEAWARASDLEAKLPVFTPTIKAVESSRGPDDFRVWFRDNDAGTRDGWQAPSFDDSTWSDINLPQTVQQAGLKGYEAHQSVLWERKTLDLTAAQAASPATLSFFADDNDVAWVNGTKIGATDGVNVPRAYKIPAGVLKAGRNLIAVRVTDIYNPGGIFGDPSSLFLQIGAEKMSLVGSWKVKLGAAVGAQNPFPIVLGSNPNLPTVLYNGMVSPLVPFGIKGAIWYQGESNADRGYQYRTLLPAMIGSWRKNFGQGDFPFLIVQLAGFQHPPAKPGEDSWAELREAQFLTGTTFKNCGIATAVDIGDMDDIHPKNKQEVGRRLAMVAEKQVYGRNVVSSGPVYKEMAVSGNAIRLSFTNTDRGLVAQGGTLKGFAVAGSDHKWYWADASIRGDKVIVSSASVPNPVAVRYYWASYVDATLANRDGWPAFPFRTDNWKLTSQK